MKKLFTSLTAMLMAVSLVGCSSNKPADNTPATAAATAEAEAEDHRAEMQAEEDAKAAKIKEEIKQRSCYYAW